MLVPVAMFAVTALTGGFLSGTVHAAAAAQNANKSVMDGVYVAEQAERGKTAVESYCVTCHAPDLSGLQGPPLAGPAFIRRWDFRNMGQLFGEIKDRMPRNDPSSLTDATYIDIVSYLLQANAFPAGTVPLKADKALLASLMIVSKEGAQAGAAPVELKTGTLVQVIGCLTQGADNTWSMTKASAPVRNESPDPSKGEARKKAEAVPLGTQTIQLVGVYTDLDSHKGQKMEGKGFLVKDPSGDRISVASIEMLEASCGQ